jgi:hypothetical protein
VGEGADVGAGCGAAAEGTGVAVGAGTAGFVGVVVVGVVGVGAGSGLGMLRSRIPGTGRSRVDSDALGACTFAPASEEGVAPWAPIDRPSRYPIAAEAPATSSRSATRRGDNSKGEPGGRE